MFKTVSAIALSVLLFAGCGASAAALTPSPVKIYGPPPPARVLQIGDSLTASSAWITKLQYADAGLDATIEGRASTSLVGPNAGGFSWRTRLKQLLKTVDPDIVVIQLGTNDAFRRTSADDFALQLDLLLLAIGDRPVYWVNVVTPSVWAEIQTGGDLVNAVLKLATWHENLTVVDVATAMASHHDLLLEDGMHWNFWGQAIYGATVVDVVHADQWWVTVNDPRPESAP